MKSPRKQMLGLRRHRLQNYNATTKSGRSRCRLMFLSLSQQPPFQITLLRLKPRPLQVSKSRCTRQKLLQWMNGLRPTHPLTYDQLLSSQQAQFISLCRLRARTLCRTSIHPHHPSSRIYNHTIFQKHPTIRRRCRGCNLRPEIQMTQNQRPHIILPAPPPQFQRPLSAFL
jgi:hypothetical protein